MPSFITSDTASVAGGDQRECKCPDKVKRCAHVGGQRLILDDSYADYRHTCGGGTRSFDSGKYMLHLTADEWISCGRTADCPALVAPYPCSVCLDFDDLPSAIAEFEQRELQLLGREA